LDIEVQNIAMRSVLDFFTYGKLFTTAA